MQGLRKSLEKTISEQCYTNTAVHRMSPVNTPALHLSRSPWNQLHYIHHLGFISVKDMKHFTLKHVTLIWKLMSYHLSEIVSEINNWFIYFYTGITTEGYLRESGECAGCCIHTMSQPTSKLSWTVTHTQANGNNYKFTSFYQSDLPPW